MVRAHGRPLRRCWSQSGSYRFLTRRWRRAARDPPPHAFELAKETEENRARLVGDRQRLDAKLLLGLQGGQLSAFLAEVGVDQVADPGVQGVLQVLNEGQFVLQGRGPGAELAQRAVGLGDRGLHLSLIHLSEPTRQAEISYAV